MKRLVLLYVDDDDDIRTVVTMALSLDPDIALRAAASGEEALTAVAAGFRPDAVVLDVMMPGMDGPALLERLRRLPPTAATPVIFMTARGRQADIDFYRARGAAGVIVKPFDPITLAQRVRALL
ncbi:MAG: response regulator [Sphingomonas adhaesiva]|uniref:response regulator n=1 Tax=Sphingomonas adhaesiva TaxID=28212 RepID=UPI002FFA03CA